MDNRPNNEKGKYITAAILVAIVAALFIWTFNKQW